MRRSSRNDRLGKGNKTASSCLVSIALLALLKQSSCQVNPPAINALQKLEEEQKYQEQLSTDIVVDDALAMQEFHSKLKANNNVDLSDFEQILNDEESSLPSHQQLLSRKRRYLLFPEGSSFQVVYDLIIGVVDYTNYLILGVTVALAWELPSKPPSEILEDLRTKLQDGNLDISRRNDSAAKDTYEPTKNSTKYINLNQMHSLPPNYYYKLQPLFQPPMHQRYSYYQGASNGYKQKQLPARRKDSYYYSNKFSTPKKIHPFYNNDNSNNRWAKPQKTYYSNAATTGGFTKINMKQNYAKYPWWQLNSRLSNSLRPAKQKDYASYYSQQQQQQQQQLQRQQKKVLPAQHQRQQQKIVTGYHQSKYKPATASQTSKTSMPRHHHHIYPVFGKRSIEGNQRQHHHQYHQQQQHPHHQQQHERQRQRRSGITGHELSKLDRIHIRHHRSTRQTLYEKIEKYLDKHKLHGEHCVLRALCETGQKSHETEPGSFVGELMRAVFTLPEALEDGRKTHYDLANAQAGDCALMYQRCKHSMWQADFIK